MPYARSDLSLHFWRMPEISRTTKLHWLREPLEGIRNLHSMGIMHRDIRPRNMLIVSAEPAQASLCDYGKAIEAESSTVTTIGPIPTLAPEVWTVSTDGPYTMKIDTWAYGYAIAEILGYSTQKYPGPNGFYGNNDAITRDRHSTILEMLRAHCSMASEDELLVDLVRKLLEWDPEKRWSASQALEHECWYPIMQEGREDEEESQDFTERPRAKKTQREDPRLKPNGQLFPQHFCWLMLR